MIPRSLQIAVRRRIAQYKRRKFAHIWPIDPSSASLPPGWKGWPDGKKFALVLSHDVDNQIGQERVLDLAKLEMKLGFRSAFNFVPERYTNHEKIKKFLRENGFEVGVHGLKHDGKLFKNRQFFNRRAQKINRYLQEWDSTGFTSPSMHHRLSWLHALNITHSISTFDTDPFEPQPEPTGIIFPFLVHKNSEDSAAKLPDSFSLPPRPKASHSACSVSSKPSNLQASRLHSFFIELPYTMPQDHLLFVILQERNIDIWKRKLDWIAKKGGMALLNTHSDYMNFNGDKLGNEEYPVDHYIELLSLAKSTYAGRFWNATPIEIASYWKRHMVDDIRSSKELCN